MKIDHLCLNVRDIEKEKAFYCQVFGFVSNAKYHNDKTGWENYFLTAGEGEARLELLSHADMPLVRVDRNSTCLVHFSLGLGSRKAVEDALAQVQKLGCEILGYPRVTGDGYFEASFLDPEGNMVELTV
ncbi:MAG: VOC family protein [Bacilli bacterium]|jgi:lactoylglutathione lyase|nr:VOC family protein [Bacilli bacterium]